MRIALITGSLAYDHVRRILKKIRTRHSVEIIRLPVEVIALLSTRDIAKSIKRLGLDVSRYDLIIVPGACRGSARIITEELGIPAVKGPIHAADLDLVLGLEDPLSILSPDRPADDVLGGILMERNKRILVELEEKASKLGIRAGGITIPLRPPPFRVVSELPGVHRLSGEELVEKAMERISEGADIVSLGFEPLNPNPEAVRRSVKRLVDHGIPVAIDTLIPSEIKAGLGAGVSLVLSIDACNIDKIDLHGINTPFVLIPYNSCSPSTTRSVEERIDLLGRLYNKLPPGAREYAVLDPILDPPVTGRILDSLQAYTLLSRRYPGNPMLMGTGNVSELVDADSVGINMVLSLLALEAGVSLLLTVEASTKTRGSTRELAIAAQMASIASYRGSPPKDLGEDLLVLKDKRRITYPIGGEGAERVELDEYRIPVKIDPYGVFKIRVNHEDGVIEALYIGFKGRRLIRSRSAEAISNYIVDKGLVSSLSHALYLGRELAKAEEALRIGKNYVQEKPLFTVKKPVRLDRGDRGEG